MYTLKSASLVREVQLSSGDEPLIIIGDVIDNEVYEILDELNIDTVFNFSGAPIARRSGFEIINLQPYIFSIVMPMTMMEHEIRDEFVSIIKSLRLSKRAYIYGDLKYIKSVAEIILVPKGPYIISASNSNEHNILLDMFSMLN